VGGVYLCITHSTHRREISLFLLGNFSPNLVSPVSHLKAKDKYSIRVLYLELKCETCRAVVLNYKCTYLRELFLGSRTLVIRPCDVYPRPPCGFCKEVTLEMHGSRICQYWLENKYQFVFDLKIGMMSFYLVINEVKNVSNTLQWVNRPIAVSSTQERLLSTPK